jgi:hypothetical protein
MKKSYNVINKLNNDVIYLIFFYENLFIKIRKVYDNISGTYLGFFIETEISTFRGFIRLNPNFLEDFDDISLENWLKENQFNLKEPSKHHLFIFGDR